MTAVTILPALATELRASLDALRGLVRGDPALKSLGRMLGAQKVYDEREAELIRSAWHSRRDRRRREVRADA